MVGGTRGDRLGRDPKSTGVWLGCEWNRFVPTRECSLLNAGSPCPRKIYVCVANSASPHRLTRASVLTRPCRPPPLHAPIALAPAIEDDGGKRAGMPGVRVVWAWRVGGGGFARPNWRQLRRRWRLTRWMLWWRRGDKGGRWRWRSRLT